MSIERAKAYIERLKTAEEFGNRVIEANASAILSSL